MSTANTPRWAALSTKKAFFIHLALSLLIFLSLVAVMINLWFPGKLFFLDGGWQGLKLVAIVDLVLGPALTLMLYKPGKPKLILDMSLIATIQIAALAYGFYATYTQRTVALVYAERAFTTLSGAAMVEASADLEARDLVPKQLNELDDGRPAVVVFPELPGEEMIKILTQMLNGYPEGHERLDLFETTSAHKTFLQNAALTDSDLEAAGTLAPVTDALNKLNMERETVQLHRFKTRYAQGIAIFDPQSNEILDYVTDTKNTAIESAEQATE